MALNTHFEKSSESDHLLRSMLLDGQSIAGPQEHPGSNRLFTIRMADSEGHRSSAHILVNRMYAGRGYLSSTRVADRNSNRITLIGSDHDVTIGTITVGFDSADGLLADECFSDLVDALRDKGDTLCEFVKLAIDSVAHSKRMLSSLFHMAFLYAYEIKKCSRIVIEVNPRHVRFYETMLGFAIFGDERLNPRVNAPAVLMSLDLAYANEQFRINSEASHDLRARRSMYNHCCSSDELEGIVSRLHRLGEAGSGKPNS